MTEREYRDIEGNVVTLDKLVRTEPEWAANVIRQLESKLDEARKRLSEEEEEHAELQSRCFEGFPTHSSIFDEYAALQSKLGECDTELAKASELLRIAEDRIAELSSRLDSLLDGIRGVLTDWPHGEAMQQNAALLALVTPVVEKITTCDHFSPGNGLPCLRDAHHRGPHRDTAGKEWPWTLSPPPIPPHFDESTQSE